jgi:hypothetical protein
MASLQFIFLLAIECILTIAKLLTHVPDIPGNPVIIFASSAKCKTADCDHFPMTFNLRPHVWPTRNVIPFSFIDYSGVMT